MKLYDVIIIGAGPAGISASLYLKRASKDVLVFYSGESNLEKAVKIDNFYGFKDGITGKELYDAGISQATNLGIELKKENIIEISVNNKTFIVKSLVDNEEKTYQAKKVILATGNKKLKPNIEGIDEYEGKGISYCAICDGFFYRNRNVIVIGDSDYAAKEAKVLENITDKIKIVTNSTEYTGNIEYAKGIEIINKKIVRVLGEETVTGVELSDGTKLLCDGIFIAIGDAGAVDFAKRIGIALDKDMIKVDDKMQTSVAGIYACGNATRPPYQIAKAVYEGMTAALNIIEELNKED